MTDQETIQKLQREVRHWKQIAGYLADCHAATAEDDGRMKSISKSRAGRFRSICQRAENLLRGREFVPYHVARAEPDEYLKDVVKRCADAQQEAPTWTK